MPRRVKCAVTSEYGLSDEFIKINGKYYKSQDIYEEDRRKKEIRKELIDYICRKFLDYYNGQPFPPILAQKLKELDFYDNEVIFEAFKRKYNDIKYALNNKQFSDDSGRVSYIFAIVKNSIADVKKQFDYSIRQKRETRDIPENTDINIAGAAIPAKDLSFWLEEGSDTFET